MSVDVPNLDLLPNQDPIMVPRSMFERNLGVLMVLIGNVTDLGYGATLVSPTKILITLGRTLSSVNTTAGRYTISGPSVINVTSVSYNPGDTFITVNVSGTFTAGVYTITLASGTFLDFNGNYNSSGPTPILNTSNVSPLEYAAVAISQTQILLGFGQTVASLNSTTSRYVVSGPSGITVGSVVYNPGDTFATVNVTGGFQAGTYTITIASGTIVDTAGNTNTTAAEPILNTSSSTSPPFIDGITPDPTLGITPMQPVSFNIKDSTGQFRQIIVLARFTMPDNSEIWDVIWDGLNFGPLYRNPYSTATPISLGYALNALRNGGWPASLSLTAYAIDKTGGENP